MSENQIDTKLEDKIVDEIKTSLTAFACVADWKSNLSVAYASAAITSGKRLYDAYKKYGVNSRELLPEGVFQNEVMNLNIQSGENFAKQLRQTGIYSLVISPATFFAKGWQQDHYMAFWERVINTFANDVRLNEDWQYSNGCSEEFLIGLQSGKKVYEGQSDKPLEPTVGVKKVREAISEIKSLNVEPTKLYEVYRRLNLLDFTRIKREKCTA